MTPPRSSSHTPPAHQRATTAKLLPYGYDWYEVFVLLLTLHTSFSVSTMATSVAASSNTPIVENMEDDDDVSIDEEQLQEYQEMVENLGEFPVRS
jgi:hypothetical protein